MGFGLVIIGYLSVFGVLPDSFIYYSWSIFIAVAGGILMLLGFIKLQEYNIYFKIMKYLTIIYILILLGFAPFLIIKNNENFIILFTLVSKIIRLCFLFVFHFFMLTGIKTLAKEIENTKVEKKAKNNILLTYIYFAAFVLELFILSNDSALLVAQIMFLFGFVYFIVTLSTLYNCYMRITYEGHDEKIDEKYEEKNNKNNNKKNGR